MSRDGLLILLLGLGHGGVREFEIILNLWRLKSLCAFCMSTPSFTSSLTFSMVMSGRCLVDLLNRSAFSSEAEAAASCCCLLGSWEVTADVVCNVCHE